MRHYDKTTIFPKHSLNYTAEKITQLIHYYPIAYNRFQIYYKENQRKKAKNKSSICTCLLLLSIPFALPSGTLPLFSSLFSLFTPSNAIFKRLFYSLSCEKCNNFPFFTEHGIFCHKFDTSEHSHRQPTICHYNTRNASQSRRLEREWKRKETRNVTLPERERAS